jgi:hypothetical protein
MACPYDPAVMSLLPLIQRLEVELHHPGIPCSRQRLEELLHPDFDEVGRSGHRYDRGTVIHFLATRGKPPEVVSDHFALTILSPSTTLLTFRSAQRDAENGLINHTLRSSIWLKSGHLWQLRYHQGTPAATPW